MTYFTHLNSHSKRALGALCLALITIGAPLAAQQGPNLTGTLPILDEDFSNGLQRYDGRRGVWTTLPRRKRVMTNAKETAFLDRGLLPKADTQGWTATIEAVPDGLALRTVKLPWGPRRELRAYMRRTGQKPQAAKVKYASAMINTSETWAQKYGYFEIEARIPRGQGRWPAFWLTYAGLGWPPEIDVFEAYGAGISAPTNKDGQFNTAVFFNGDPMANPYDNGALSKTKQRPTGPIRQFRRSHRSLPAAPRTIYDDFNIYAVLWTPTDISFYFGPDRQSLQLIYRTPTPPNAQAPMYIIANDQFTARGGWWPAETAALAQVLDPENAFVIKRIRVRALEPALQLALASGGAGMDDRDSVITDTAGDDLIVPGDGMDVITLTGGADHLRLTRGIGNKIISGFGADDLLELRGYPFEDEADILARLTQVGPDVWLPSGADPADPQTIVFRNALVGDFTAGQFDNRWPLALDIWASDAALNPQRVLDRARNGRILGRDDGNKLSDNGDAITMLGRAGPDIYFVANMDTVVQEAPQGGLDQIVAHVTYELPSHIEHGVIATQGRSLTGTPGDDRLEARAPRTLLRGGAGDDLYVIAPGANTTLSVAAGDGHDVVQGFGPGNRLAPSQALSNNAANWQYLDDPEGVRLVLSPTQSITFEGLDEAALRPILLQP